MNLTAGSSISVIGSAHSCSELWISSEIITLDSMPKVFKDVSESGRPPYSTVFVSANTSFRECMQLLADQGRTLPATGGVDEQQIGGLLATNTAPASKEFTIYSDLKEIEYVTKDDAHNKATGEDLKALITNLGLVGVVTYITIGTIPNYGMRAIQRILPVEDLAKLMVEGENFKSGEPEDGSGKDEKEYKFWRMDCIPQVKSDSRDKPGNALLWAARMIEGEDDPAYEHYEQNPDGDYVDQYKYMPASMLIFDAVQKQSQERYSLDPYNNIYIESSYKLMEMLIAYTPKRYTFYGPLKNMLPVDRFMNKNLFCAMAEWAFLPKDLETVMKIYQEYFHFHEWPNLPIEVEYVKCDDNYMSPWNSNKMIGGPVEYLVKVNIMWFFSKNFWDLQDGKMKTRSPKEQEIVRDQIEIHAKGLWNQLKEKDICFKAHWGKINFTTPEEVEQLYEWEKFKPYIQPEMMNEYYKERLPKLENEVLGCIICGGTKTT